MGKLIPLILALVGLGGGVGAGLALRPLPEPEPEHVAQTGEAEHEGESAGKTQAGHTEDEDAAYDYARLNNQFVIPVVHRERVHALVVMSITLEIESGQTEAVFQREPKLRDLFLRVLFDHANTGGFDGPFTESGKLKVLRRNLREASLSVLGDVVHDILITDLVRQEV